MGGSLTPVFFIILAAAARRGLPPPPPILLLKLNRQGCTTGYAIDDAMLAGRRDAEDGAAISVRCSGCGPAAGEAEISCLLRTERRAHAMLLCPSSSMNHMRRRDRWRAPVPYSTLPPAALPSQVSGLR
jgi:hypothetical protein